MRRFLVALVVTVLGGTALVLVGAQPASAATATLPNLRMARLNNFQIGSDPSLPGRTLLRFNTTIVNTGPAGGVFEVLGSRSSTSSTTMNVRQVLHYSDGSTASVPTNATMVYDTGDGHQHWHVLNLETYRATAPNGRVLTSPKVGFCFYDNNGYDLSLPGAPQTPVFTDCGSPSSLSVRTGLSVGWGDTYPAERFNQWVDITGQGNGQYRLTAIADPNHYFREANAVDNTTWVVLSIRGNKIKVLRYGP